MVHHYLTPGAFAELLAPPGTSQGDQKRDEFLAAVQAILGDTRLLWTPKSTDTTTATEDSRHADTITWDATVAARLSTLGSGLAQDFDGTNDQGDTTDSDVHRFGDGAVDQPMSVLALFNPDVVNETDYLFTKSSSTTAQEWEFWIHSSGIMEFHVFDESASATLDVASGSLTAGAYNFMCATYDGSGAKTGLSMYKNGVLSTNRGLGGTYVAMEDTGGIINIGARFSTKAGFFNGKIALIGLCAKALTIEEVWAIKALCNSFFSLSL